MGEIFRVNEWSAACNKVSVGEAQKTEEILKTRKDSWAIYFESSTFVKRKHFARHAKSFSITKKSRSVRKREKFELSQEEGNW